MTMSPARPTANGAHPPSGGVGDPRRLAAVARTEMHGHMGDPDLNAIVATLRIACGVPIAVINIVHKDKQVYPAEVGVGAPCTLIPDALSFCAEVVENGTRLVVSDATSHPVYVNNPLVRDGVVRSYAGSPLVDGAFVLGSVSIFDGRVRRFTDDELTLLDHQARLASSVLALRRSAHTDALTGLGNRKMLLGRLPGVLARLQRHGGLAAVMYLDLDGFKQLNDERGHDAGDRLLVEVAERWSAVLRPTDTLTRVGGDEFVALCEDVATQEGAVVLANRMIAALPDSLASAGRPLAVSIGVVLADGSAQDPTDLVRAADAEMYRAKEQQGSSWALAPR